MKKRHYVRVVQDKERVPIIDLLVRTRVFIVFLIFLLALSGNVTYSLCLEDEYSNKLNLVEDEINSVYDSLLSLESKGFNIDDYIASLNIILDKVETGKKLYEEGEPEQALDQLDVSITMLEIVVQQVNNENNLKRTANYSPYIIATLLIILISTAYNGYIKRLYDNSLYKMKPEVSKYD